MFWRTITEEKVLGEQGAFRKGRNGCVDHLFTVRQLGEKTIERI